jgi:hypothetical protein
MAAIFGTNIRGYSANAFIDALNIDKQLDQWTTDTSYLIGKTVYYGNRKYISATTGISGALPPTHANGSGSDGALNWIFVDYIKVDNNFKNNLYLFYAKKTAWLNENLPDTPNASDLQHAQILNDIIAIKKLNSSSLRLSARRYNWTSGVVYSQYDSAKDKLSSTDYPTPFYVLNSQNEIFKCINNNNGSPSTSEPVGPSLSYVSMIDKYVWFYMGTLSSTDSLLLSSDFFPVNSLNVDDGSDQWTVQQNAKPLSISTFQIVGNNSTFTTAGTATIFGDGTNATATPIKNSTTNLISQILVNDPGTNYHKELTYCVVKETNATGSGAQITPVIWYNSINPVVNIVNQGSGYTTATAQIIPTTTGTGATATVQIGSGINLGKIVGVTITNPGKDYVGGATLQISGDGTNANILLTINSTGVIGSITIDSGQSGSGYSTANIIIVGDGTGAAANVSAFGAGGSISSINVVNRGSGYTNAKAFLIAGTAGAIGYPIMAPSTGHGSNIAAELAANTALISTSINSSNDVDYFILDQVNGFRQVGLICNVVEKGTSVDCIENLYIGPSHPEYSNNSSSLKKINNTSGFILYLSNIKKATRNANQEETLRIPVSF